MFAKPVSAYLVYTVARVFGVAYFKAEAVGGFGEHGIVYADVLMPLDLIEPCSLDCGFVIGDLFEDEAFS